MSRRYVHWQERHGDGPVEAGLRSAHAQHIARIDALAERLDTFLASHTVPPCGVRGIDRPSRSIPNLFGRFGLIVAAALLASMSVNAATSILFPINQGERHGR